MDNEIFKITPDKIRAEDLFIIANERLNDIIKVLPKDKSYKILEEYYEAILELITALMYVDGYKTLSHVKAIEYLSKNYSVLSDFQLGLIDNLRKIRHGIVYYGRKVSQDFLINNQEEILIIANIINKLLKFKLR